MYKVGDRVVVVLDLYMNYQEEGIVIATELDNEIDIQWVYIKSDIDESNINTLPNGTKYAYIREHISKELFLA